MGIHLCILRRISLWHFKDLHYRQGRISFSQGLSHRLRLLFVEASRKKQQLKHNKRCVFDRNSNWTETWAHRATKQLKKCHLILRLDIFTASKSSWSLTGLFLYCITEGNVSRNFTSPVPMLDFFLLSSKPGIKCPSCSFKYLKLSPNSGCLQTPPALVTWHMKMFLGKAWCPVEEGPKSFVPPDILTARFPSRMPAV